MVREFNEPAVDFDEKKVGEVRVDDSLLAESVGGWGGVR